MVITDHVKFTFNRVRRQRTQKNTRWDIADHLLTVAFTDTPQKAHFGGSMDNVNIKQQNLTIFVCLRG